MFANDTNLFCSGKHIKTLFQTANIELEKIAIWFQANKLSLNESKTKFTLFHKSWDKDNLPLKLPILKINNFEIKRTTSIKFLGIMVDENLTWNDHIHILENELSKNIGQLYREKPYLEKNAMKTLYFSFFHSYLNYGNITWASTTKSKLRRIASQQREAVNAIPKNGNQEIMNSRMFMEENGILNVYRLNLYQVINFMFRVHNETIPKRSQTTFQYIEHRYETRQSKDNFIIPKRNTEITRFAISSHGPRIWNSLTNNPTKTIDFYPLFKSIIKENLLKLKTETNYLTLHFLIFPSSYLFLSFLLLKIISLVEKA